MNVRVRQLLIVAALGVAVTAVVAQRARRTEAPSVLPPGMLVSSHNRTDASSVSTVPLERPRLVDVGAESCVPCKMMVPVLADLRRDYAGALDVVFIDVWKDPDAGTPYDVKIIPTQIFFDASGREVYRHVGFFAKAEILAVWKQLGIDLKPTARSSRP